MRAAAIKEYGAPPVPTEHSAPTRSEGQALTAVTAAPIIPLDVLCATGTSYFGAPPLPYVPGVQGVGRVVQASSVPEGSRVWFPATAGMRPGDGSMAELALAAEAELVILPDAVEDTLVAALGLSAVAAWMALTWRARMLPGEQVLVLGAGGVVGQVAVQAAKRLGARRVVAACGQRRRRSVPVPAAPTRLCRCTTTTTTTTTSPCAPDSPKPSTGHSMW